jgi:hypothetical protein
MHLRSRLLQLGFVLELISAILAAVQVFFRNRLGASIEILALRQQPAVFKRKHPRPKLGSVDRLFWTILRRIWSGWAEALIIVKPDTVVRRHRTGFRLYWRWRSRAGSGGRPKTTAEIRTLICCPAEENLGWGAPKIHGELLKLGCKVSERTVARYLPRIRRRVDPSKRWRTFLRNHREVIVALDFFTVPTMAFKLLYCFFAIEHNRRKILHINTTCHPTAGGWQQLRETFPEAGQYRYVILDRDSKFDRRRHPLPKGHGGEAHAHEHPPASAKWNCGTLGGKLSS